MILSVLLPVVTALLGSTVTLAQQTAWGQCGGLNWTGPTTCVAGWTCVYSNDWYSQCIQSTGGGGPTSVRTSTRTSSSAVATSTRTFKNPIKYPNGSDPWITYSNGWYYLMTTTWSNLQLHRGRTMQELKTSSPKVIWTDSTPSRCCNFWAPEIHQIDGTWYIYYTGGATGNYDNQRIHAIRASSSDLWAATWSYAGRIAFPNRDVWSIDATIVRINNINYMVYSTQDNGAQCLFIAQMTGPTTVGNASLLSRPTYSWEREGWNVNEGPEPLYRNGRTWIVFSASLCEGTGYKLGRMEYIGGNPLSQSSWVKHSQPIMTSANGNYQPGHNGFFTTPSGATWIVYHANPTTPGTCGGDRRTMVQPVSWASDGNPIMPVPAPLSQDIPEPV